MVVRRGRKPGPYPDSTPPTDTDLLPQPVWVWVEGKIFLQPWNTEGHLAKDKAAKLLSSIGLVLHTQDGMVYNEHDKARRSWTTKRVDLDYAEAALSDFPAGLTVTQFAEELFKESGWTDQHLKAAVTKTHVIIHKLKKQGLITKGPGGVYFTNRQRGKGIPPVLLSIFKTQFDQMGIPIEEPALRKLIRFSIDAVKSAVP